MLKGKKDAEIQTPCMHDTHNNTNRNETKFFLIPFALTDITKEHSPLTRLLSKLNPAILLSGKDCFTSVGGGAVKCVVADLGSTRLSKIQSQADSLDVALHGWVWQCVALRFPQIWGEWPADSMWQNQKNSPMNQKAFMKSILDLNQFAYRPNLTFSPTAEGIVMFVPPNWKLIFEDWLEKIGTTKHKS